MSAPTVTYASEAERLDAEARLEHFMATHVGRYVLPKKLEAAQAKGAATVSVPTYDMVRLLARTGEVVPTDVQAAPAFPAALGALPAQLLDGYDWDAEDCAIVTREQLSALVMTAARNGYAQPRATVRKVTATVAEAVHAAHCAGKANVTVPTADLAHRLELVEIERKSR